MASKKPGKASATMAAIAALEKGTATSRQVGLARQAAHTHAATDHPIGAPARRALKKAGYTY